MNLGEHRADFWRLNALHIINDGFQASLVLFLPFIALTMGLSYAQIGSLGTALNLMSVIMAWPTVWLAHRLGGVRAIALAALLAGAVFVGIGVAVNFGWLLVLFTLGGIGFGVFHPVAFALISDWVPKQQRGRALGDFTAVGDIGRIALSSALPVMVVWMGWSLTAMIYGALAIAVVGTFWLITGQSRVEVAPKKAAGKQPISLGMLLRNRLTSTENTQKPLV